MPSRHLLSITDLSDSDLLYLVRRAADMRRGLSYSPLAGKTVGIYFRKTSTRTRTSFSAGALKLGASIVAYGPADLQTNTGESLEDTAVILSAYLDALVMRTAGPIEEMRTFAAQQSMAVVNAMSELEHPTQAISDLSTLLEHFGRLRGLHVAYFGEGNNTATALALAIGRMPGMRLSLFTPNGYGLPAEIAARARAFAAHCGACVEERHDLRDLPRDVDAVYATRWQTTGSTKADPSWERHFAPYRVTNDLIARVARGPDTVFMHDLPAVRGQDVDADVLDGPRSVAFRQAANKLYSAMAVLEWCVTPVAVEITAVPPAATS